MMATDGTATSLFYDKSELTFLLLFLNFPIPSSVRAPPQAHLPPAFERGDRVRPRLRPGRGRGGLRALLHGPAPRVVLRRPI